MHSIQTMTTPASPQATPSVKKRSRPGGFGQAQWAAALAMAILAVSEAPAARADMSTEEYSAAIKAAARQARKNHDRDHEQTLVQVLGYTPLNGGFPSPRATLEQQPLPQPFKPGLSWEVATFHQTLRMSHRMDSPATGVGTLSTFHYAVANPTGTQLTITPTESDGAALSDARVQNILITLNERDQEVEKSYLFKGQSSRISVSPNGPRSPMTAVEGSPIDFPDVLTAERVEGLPVAELPAALQQFLARHGYSADPKRGPWYETSDLFGRPVEMMWIDGEPWPRILKTAQGFAVLLKKESA